MKQNDASRTAEYMALFRALESLRPRDARLFEDPFAKSFLSPSLRGVVKLAQVPILRKSVNWLIDRKWPGARASGIARTRFIDDVVATAVQDGIEQMVILGAGFDCRAYRTQGVERIRVYEVDHPTTLAAKQEQLQQVLGALPLYVTFVEVDFNQQRLADALSPKKFDASRRTLFIWEGVTNYLTEEAVDATLCYISGTSVGSQLVFTYVHRAVLDNPAEFDGTRNLIHLLQHEDEPWTFGLYPDDVPAYLKARGFELIEDIGSVKYRARYMNPDGLHMKGYEFYRIAVARIVGK